MSIKLYQTRIGSNQIYEFEAEEVTEKYYFVDTGDPSLRRGSFSDKYYRTFFTKEEAIEWRRACLKRYIHDAHLAVAKCTRKLEEFEASLLK